MSPAYDLEDLFADVAADPVKQFFEKGFEAALTDFLSGTMPSFRFSTLISTLHSAQYGLVAGDFPSMIGQLKPHRLVRL